MQHSDTTLSDGGPSANDADFYFIKNNPCAIIKTDTAFTTSPVLLKFITLQLNIKQ